MRKYCHLSTGVTLSLAVLLASAGMASALAIPADQLDEQKIFYGTAGNFDKAAEVDYEAVVKATPEYEKIRKEKIAQGSAKYWILISQASDRAVQAISSTGRATSYDLIASSGYLGELDPPIPADDITGQVLKYLED